MLASDTIASHPIISYSHQVEHTKDLLRMKLAPNSKWRANPANLPGPLVLLAVDAGAGFVPVGPTEAKKGRTVRTMRMMMRRMRLS